MEKITKLSEIEKYLNEPIEILAEMFMGDLSIIKAKYPELHAQLKEYRSKNKRCLKCQKFNCSSQECIDYIKKYNENKTQKIKQTKLQKYGSTNYNNSDKMLKTKQERYGDIKEFYSKTSKDAFKGYDFTERNKKTNETLTKKFGSYENYLQYNREKVKESKQFVDETKALEKRKQTNNEKFGFDNIFKNVDYIKQKTKEKLGVEHCMQDPEIRAKTEETNLKRYGVRYVLQNDDIKEKIKRTNILKYGVENVMMSPEIRNKVIETNLNRYGVECAIQSDVVKEKLKETWVNKTEEEYNIFREKIKYKWFIKDESSKNAIISRIKNTKLKKYGDSGFNNREKYKQTSLERYGFENAWQNPEIQNKVKITNILKYSEIKDLPEEDILEFIKREYPEYLDFNFSQKHIKNYINLNEGYFRTFIEGNYFDVKKCMNYYNLSYTTVQRYKKEFNIQEPNKTEKHKIQSYIFDNIKDDTKVLNARNLISKELDIFIPSINLAIEYNGLMFHSQGISEHSMFNTPDFDKMYHLKKTLECKAKGITLFHIFEGEDLDLWLSMINNKLGLNERIFARKCEIREISNKECIEFLNSNHIQGYIPSKINIGLYYNFEYIDDFSKEKISKSTLVSLMTFSKPRFNNQYDYELIRFCSLKGFNVIGGASKLWKYFLKKYNPKSVISYANRRFSNGEVYQKLGFSLKGESGVNYFYFKDSLKLESRNKYQKHKLKNILEYYNPNESEHINMFKNGYRRIFDCGNLVFEYKNENSAKAENS